ncbi:MAG TPA: arylesterase [Rhodocyclaceae bacterium]|nr:arylesterase [Rhodocyclaceae bacterium]
MQRREFLTFLGLGLLAACGKPQRLPTVAAGASVLAFGDSVTFGTGASPGEGWPARLAEATGWNIHNAGIPGDTAQNGKSRLPALLDEHQPALVIVEIGGNDFLRRRPPNAVKEDLREIIRTARQTGAQVVLVGVPELSLLAAVARRLSDSPIYEALAEEEKIALIPDVFSEVLAKPELCADQIHPNAQGYRQMAEGMHARLRELGLAAR